MPVHFIYFFTVHKVMTKYELMVIIDNDNDQSAAETFCQETVIGKIKEIGGIPTFEDFWGPRGFAYKINKKTWGYYFVTQFDAEPNTIDEIKKAFNINTSIIRFLITKVDKKAPAPKKYADMKTEYEAQEKSKKEEIDETRTLSYKKEKLTTIKKDAVDKKLDAIIDESAKDL